MTARRIFFYLLFIVFLISGCLGFGKKDEANPNFAEPGVRLIAILPVDNKTVELEAPRLMREAMLEELYFKGYQKVPLDLIDVKLTTAIKESQKKSATSVPPKMIAELLGVDAVLYTTLKEVKTSYDYVTAPTSVSASFELKSTRTGQTLWKSDQKAVIRNFGLTKKSLEMKSYQVYEKAVQEVVQKAIRALPDGPNYAG
jgi:hypothetical protein